jgi:hypothetical protein
MLRPVDANEGGAIIALLNRRPGRSLFQNNF